MWCVLLLSFCIAVARALGVSDGQFHLVPAIKRPQWYEYAEQCCNHELTLKDLDEHTYDKQLLRECASAFSVFPHYPACEPERCFAMKKGYGTPDGHIKKHIFEILLGVEFQYNTDTLKKILADCVYGDLSKYPPQICELKRVNMCISVHIQEEVLWGCNDWKDHFRCLNMRLQVTMNVQKYLPKQQPSVINT